MGNICGFEWVFDGLPRRCVEFAGHIGAHRTAPFGMVAAVNDVRSLAARLAAAEARAEKAEGEVRYLREWKAWVRRPWGSSNANPEPQPPLGVEP